MHSYIITGRSHVDCRRRLDTLLTEWQVETHDIRKLVTEGSIGIAAVKDFIQTLQYKPNTDHFSVGVIEEAHHLTEEAQNALLKTLEEPPPHARIILLTYNKDVLLPTILSRCTVMVTDTPGESGDTKPNTVMNILSGSTNRPGDISRTDDLPQDRETALAQIDEALQQLYGQLPQPSDGSAAATGHSVATTVLRIKRLLKIKMYLMNNVNVKLALDMLVLPDVSSPIDNTSELL